MAIVMATTTTATTAGASRTSVIMACTISLWREIWISTDLLFSTKLTWLLLLGPVALIGDATGWLGEAICFACSGLALIPCAERLSFVTEQVAAHTNGTIGALLNATFGNAPELLISTAALRSGFYRVVQLAMLGSMLCNLLFVFGVSCLVGGCRWQVQELRITSGNVSVMMLLVGTAGSLLPAALAMSGQMKDQESLNQQQQQQSHSSALYDKPSDDELAFCRVNAVVMIIMYISYLMFQLGTHKEEFDEEENIVETPDNVLIMSPHFTSRHGRKQRAERNHFCLKWFCFPQASTDQRYTHLDLMEGGVANKSHTSDPGIEMATSPLINTSDLSESDDSDEKAPEEDGLFRQSPNNNNLNNHSNSSSALSLPSLGNSTGSRRRRRKAAATAAAATNHNRSFEHQELGVMRETTTTIMTASPKVVVRAKSHQASPMTMNQHQIANPSNLEEENSNDAALPNATSNHDETQEPIMSFRVGIVWLFIITLCISAMSDILVDTIDGFASRCRLSEVFTSMVILPFFSNVAEQVSAILFAYRNEMDLCVGVTVGSAVQIAMFVLPGCVIAGMIMDRSMTLFFHGYETACLFLGVVCVAAILQGGTTNWLVGMSLIGIYVMMAAGFWFHELENLSTDEELIFQNATRMML